MSWIEEIPAGRLFLSAVTIGEIQAGIERTREQDRAKAAELEFWLGRVVESYGILPMDVAAFREWARLKHRRSDSLFEDAMIAATARVHRLTVATRKRSRLPEIRGGIVRPVQGRVNGTEQDGKKGVLEEAGGVRWRL